MSNTTTTAPLPDEVRLARRLRFRKDLDQLDFRRTLANLTSHYSQRQVADWLGLSQPTVSNTLRTALKDRPVPPGFSGATPKEICERYAAGMIDRDRLVHELSTFDYAPGAETDGYDSLLMEPAGTWLEVQDALRRGLIEDDVYTEVFDRLTS